MKVIVNSQERYPEWELTPAPNDKWAWSIPDELYERHVKALAEFQKVQDLIKEWRDSLPWDGIPEPNGCGSCG